MKLVFVLLSLFVNTIYATSSGLTPRGVPLSKLSFYKVNEPFTCLDNSNKLPWYKVNDDYCDCQDGSDEPGTSACPNSLFYCVNKYHRSKLLPSARVDDGLCDCCDGSDENGKLVTCNNTCWEMGKAEREANEIQRRELEQGKKVYENIVKQAQEKMNERKLRINDLDNVVSTAEEEKKAAETEKQNAEVPEKEILDRRNAELTELKAKWNEGKVRRAAERAFRELDVDNNGLIGVEEMQTHKEFDVDHNGEVSEGEVNEYLSDAEVANMDYFVDKVWPNIKDIYRRPGQQQDISNDKKDTSEQKETKDEDSDDKLKSEQDGTTSPATPDQQAPAPVKEAEPEEQEPSLPEMDEGSKAVVAAAEKSREAYKKAEENLKSVENERKDIESLLAVDYGPESAFFMLADSNDCYSMKEREYIYTICPFKRVTQKSGEGGSETSLGVWGKWQDDANSRHKYHMQLYENGQNCWNGPNRSTKVTLLCGSENKVIKVEEPSRCVYTMTFLTPAACGKDAIAAQLANQGHDEL